MKKTVLKAKKSVKKVKSTAKKVSKAVVQNSKKLTKKVALGARAINDFAKNGFNGREVASAIVDFIPVVGNVKGAYEATFGKDPITGRKLDKAERVAAGAAVIGGPLVKGGTRGVKVVSGIVSGGKKSTAKGSGNRPSDLSPKGAGRNGAFREAKRNSGIPVSQHPKKVTPAVDRRGKRIPGRDYDFGDGKVIRDHSGGHEFPDDPRQNRGPHFNDVDGEHYDYAKKRGK